jgi:hypothetical protein
VGRGAQYANPRAGKTVKAITGMEDKQGNTSLEKEEMLRYKPFPPNDGDQYYELPPPGIVPTCITGHAVN